MINLVLDTKSITETLLYDTVLLTIVLILAYALSGKGKPKESEHIQMRMNKVLDKFVMMLSIATLFLGLLPLNTIERPKLYFILQGVLAGIVLMLYVKERIGSSVTIFYTIVSFLSILIIVYSKNMFYPRYDVAQEALYITGSLEPYMKASVEGGFYYFIPVDPLIIVPLAYVCGEDIGFLLPAVRNFIVYLVIMLSIFAIIKRTGLKPLYASILAYTIVPTLSFQDRILSLPYVNLILYILFLAISSGRLDFRLNAILVIVSAVSVFAHPVGPIALISMLSLSILLTKVFKGICEEAHRVLSFILLLFTLIAFTYWFFTHIYILLMTKTRNLFDATVRFIDFLLRRDEAPEILLGYTISPYTLPAYSDPKFYTYAYVWALPLAVASSLLLVSLVKVMTKKRDNKVNEVFTFGLASSLSTLIFIGTAYIGYTMNIEPGQYLIPTGYYASTLAMGVALHEYSIKRRLGFFIFTVLLALGVGLGLHSPNWAPLEHPDFKTSIKMLPYTNYIEASCIIKYLSEGLTVYSVYDFPVGARGKMPNYMLDQIRLGNVAGFKGIIIGLNANDPLLSSNIQYLSLLYSTGNHVLAMITS